MALSTLLPEKLWYRVFRYLDGASLLAVAVADPESAALHPSVLRSVTFLPDINEGTLETFFTGEDNANGQHVMALRFSDCVALASAALLSCATACESLRELYIVNCAVHPTRLFEALPKKLRQLEVLEWSLLEKQFYFEDAGPDLGAYDKMEMAKSLRSMYVDVVTTPQNMLLLVLIIDLCPELLHLHVHAIRKADEGESSLGLLVAIMRPGLRLDTFTHTSERIPKPGSHARYCFDRRDEPLRLLPEEAMWGNLTHHFKPEGDCSFVSLTDILEQKASLRGVRQAIVAVEGNTQASFHLFAAASKPEFFTHVRSLTLALYPPRKVLFPEAPTAHLKHLYTLQLLFQESVSALTELNLTAFHFSRDADVSLVIGSALRLLRELAIAPCGVNHPDSLKFLARGCNFLEVLDVGTEKDSLSTFPCNNCRRPLPFTESCFESLNRRTRLRRLSLDETATLHSLAFLRQCRVSELRLTTNASVYDDLAELLRANPLLSVLTIEDQSLTLARDNLAVDIGKVRSLRRLCVLSGAPTEDSVALSFMEHLKFELPFLELLHVHYLAILRIPHRASARSLPVHPPDTPWILPRRVVATRQVDNPKGVFYNKPCVGCYTSTFIGRARPRNRH